MAEKFTEFDYLLNRMELAGQNEEPAKHGYGDHRRALYAYVRKLEATAADRDRLAGEVERHAQRLDWIRRQGSEFDSGLLTDRHGKHYFCVYGMEGAYGEGKTFIEALDAAIDSSLSAGSGGERGEG